MMLRSSRVRLLLLVLVMGVGAGTADHLTAGVAEAPPAPAALWGTMPVVASPSALSSTWYCTGGTSSHGGGANNVFELTNVRASTAYGTMSLVVPGAPAVVVPLSIPAASEEALSPQIYVSGSWDAATIDFTGGGIGVVQTAVGPNGWAAAPCATTTSPAWYFAGGTTADGSSIDLSLYNPTATEAAVDLTFATGSGLMKPPTYQGLVVPPGQLVVENIGDYVQQQPDVATDVEAVFGQVVAGETQAWVGSSGAASAANAPSTAAAPPEGLALLPGAPAAAARWTFPSTVDSTGASVEFHLFNPTRSPSEATFAIALGSGSAQPVSVVVPPRTDDVLVASDLTRIPDNVFYATTVTTRGPPRLVVFRTVTAAAGQPSPSWGDELGVAGVSRNWLLPAPGTPGAPGITGAAVADVVMSNPGAVPVHVHVRTLAGADVLPNGENVTVPPGRWAILGQSQYGALEPLRFSGSGPIVVSEDDIPAGMVGVVGLQGLPIS